MKKIFNGHTVHASILVLLIVVIVMGISIAILSAINNDEHGKVFFENRDLIKRLEIQRSKIDNLKELPKEYYEELITEYGER